MASLPRVILHVDMDAFYAAVEVRENPELAGKPVIVGHPGRRGVVSTCSYEARRFGVRSAMPSVTARRLCPDAVWLPGRMQLYVETSRAIRALFREMSPVVQPLSIDEAFLDLTGICGDLQAGAATADLLKRRIRDEQRLSASVGIAPNKFLAKVASDLEKPDGLTILPLEQIESILWPLPVRRLWGVGPKTAERLQRGGVVTIGDIALLEPKTLEALVGPNTARHLHGLAHGRDERPVENRQVAKSLSEERTYAVDLTDPAEIDRALLNRSERVARALRRDGIQARTVQIKVRAGDFTTWTRAETLDAATDLAEPIVGAARRLLAKVPLAGRGIRLLGVGASGLEPSGSGQARLFEDPERQRARKLAAAADAVRDRLGEAALTRATLLPQKNARRSDGDGNADDEASSLPSVD